MKTPSRTAGPLARGFTLIELMMVVAIIGLLASVAIPVLQRLTMRSKQAERRHVITTIKDAVQDIYVRYGDLPPDAAGVPLPALVGPTTPALPPGLLKRAPNWGQADWNQLFSKGASAQVEGAVYYSYNFWVTRTAGAVPATLFIRAEGDLDGDGVSAVRIVTYQRDDGGTFRALNGGPAEQYPVDWLDGGTDDGLL